MLLIALVMLYSRSTDTKCSTTRTLGQNRESDEEEASQSASGSECHDHMTRVAQSMRQNVNL